MKSKETFLQKYIANEVCVHKNVFLLPAVPAYMFLNIFNPFLFFTSWGIVVFLWLILWLAVPCNPNLNCTEPLDGHTQGKDGTKALFITFIAVYATLFVLAVGARFLICEDPKKGLIHQEHGGILSNIFSLNKKVPLGHKPKHQSEASKKLLTKYEWKNTSLPDMNVQNLVVSGRLEAIEAVNRDIALL